MSKYAAVNVKFGADISEFSTAMQNATRQMKKASDQLINVGKSMTMNLTAPVVALGAAALYSFGEIDSLKRGLVSFAGSAELAEAEFNKLRKVAELPGLGLEEAVRGSINLQAIGMNADDARRAMMSFGNAIATVGGGKENFDLAIRGFGQLVNASKPLQQDLYQIANQLPQVNKLMMDAFGTNRAEDLAKLGLSGKQLADFLVTELGKLPKVSGGIKNAFENMSDSVKISLSKLGEALEKNFNISGLIDRFAGWLNRVVEAFSQLDPAMQKFILAAVGIVAAIGPVMVGLGGILKLLPLITSGFAALSTAAPYLLAIAAAAVLVYQNWDVVKKTIFDVANYFIDLYNTSLVFKSFINGQIAAFKNMILGLQSIFKLIWINVETLGRGISTIVSGIGKLFKAVITGEFGAIPDIAKEMFTKLVAAAKQGATEFGAVMKEMGTGIYTNIKDGVDKTVDKKPLAKLTYEATKVKEETNKTTKTTTKGEQSAKYEPVVMESKKLDNQISDLVKTAQSAMPKVEMAFTDLGDRAEWALTESAQKMQRGIENMNRIISSGVQDMTVSLLTAFGENLVDKDPFKDLGNVLLNSLGNLMVQLGTEMLVFGGFFKLFQESIKKMQPEVAIAAGIGMIVAGAAISKIAQKGMQPTVGGYGSTSSSSGSSVGGDLTLTTRVDGRDLVMSGDETTRVKRR